MTKALARIPKGRKREYEVVERALREGGKLHAFRSGGGLRVIRIEKGRHGKLIAYGEHPSFDEALVHLAEDFEAGGRPYNKVYGKIYDNYLTGSMSPSSDIDAWVLKGSPVDASVTPEGKIAVVLSGYSYTRDQAPPGLMERVLSTGVAEMWKARGYTFCSYKSYFPGNGEPCMTTKTLVTPPGRINADSVMYRVSKTGIADTLEEAIAMALVAPEVELLGAED